MINPVLNIAPPPAQNASQKPGEAKNSDGFGAVLARQIDNKTAAKTASPDKTPDNKTTKTTKTEKSTTATKQTSQDQAPQATAPDASTNPLLLLVNQGFKTAATGTSVDVNTSGQPIPDQIPAPDAASMAVLGQAAAAASGVAAGTTIQSKSSAQAHQTGIVSAREKLDPATAPSTKAEPVITAQPGSKTGTETVKVAELAASLPGAVPSAQVQAQSAGALVASSQQPNTASNPNTTIAAPLGSRAWPDEFSQKISWVSTQQNQVAELHLNPPDLGPMSVVLTISDNQATALFTSPHLAVREAIENALPKLRESLAENGIMLGNATVSDQTPRDSGAGNFMNQRSNTRTDTGTDDSSTSTLPANLPAMPASRHNGMVDTFA
ncbi:MAG: flagellar hook-length control protein FliK [Gallionella sp.]|nr:flagellar hook-length control protein FliK [Gallionella sp.]